MEQENKPRLYVVMTQEILCRKDISTAAKLLFARISGFEEYFESSKMAGELLGKSEETIKKAKQELERLGLIKCIKNTGRGKAYCAVLDYRVVEKYQSEWSNLSSQSGRKLPPYNKVENKDYNISNKLDIVQEAPKDEQKEYGNQQVNELMATWKQETGVEANSAKANRLAAYNLIRSKGMDGAIAIVRLCGRAMRSKDQYAPVISSFRDLQGRYEKLSKLLAWERRQEAVAPTPIYRKQSTEIEVQEISDEERAEVLKKVREMRKTIKI